MVVIQVNAVDKAVDEPLFTILRGDVDLAEVVECKKYLILRQDGVARLCLEQLYLKVSLALFQLVQRFLRRGGIDALRDRLYKVIQLGLHTCELRLDRRLRTVLLQLQFIDAVSKFLDDLIACKQLLDLIQHEFFQPLLSDGFFIALTLLGVIALVVAVLPRGVTGADDARHHCPALPAKESRREQVVILAPVHGRGFFVACHALLHGVESVFIDDCRHGVRQHDVAELVLANILAVGEDAEDGVVLHLKALMADAALVEQFDDVIDAHSVKIAREDLSHDRHKRFVDLIVVGIIHIIAEGRTHAVALCFEGVLRHAALDLFGKFRRIEFGIAFEDSLQQDTVRALRDAFLRGNNAHTVLFENVLVVGGIVAVAGKAVELPDKNAVKRALVAVLDHSLEFGAMVSLCRLRPVYVIPDDLYPVEVGVL